MKKSAFVMICGIGLMATRSMATETITYSYDAQGRLIKAVTTGTVNNGVQVVYQHDKADNRVRVTVTGGH